LKSSPDVLHLISIWILNRYFSVQPWIWLWMIFKFPRFTEGHFFRCTWEYFSSCPWTIIADKSNWFTIMVNPHHSIVYSQCQRYHFGMYVEVIFWNWCTLWNWDSYVTCRYSKITIHSSTTKNQVTLSPPSMHLWLYTCWYAKVPAISADIPIIAMIPIIIKILVFIYFGQLSSWFWIISSRAESMLDSSSFSTSLSIQCIVLCVPPDSMFSTYATHVSQFFAVIIDKAFYKCLIFFWADLFPRGYRNILPNYNPKRIVLPNKSETQTITD